MDRIVLRMLEKNPHDRFQTMDELLAALKVVAAPGAYVGEPSYSSGPLPPSRLEPADAMDGGNLHRANRCAQGARPPRP